MKRILTLLAALLFAPPTALHAQSPQRDAPGAFAAASRLEEFLGEPVLGPMQPLWKGRGGWGGIVAARDGTMVVFRLYSNLDTDSGEMPKQVGASTSKGRERITVWASFDGGRTWPVQRLVHDGPSAYSNLGVGRSGTPGQGRIFLVFEGGPKDCYEAVNVVSFNLAWLLNGREVAGFAM